MINQDDVKVRCREEEEIDLRRLWKTLIKRRMLIGILTGLVTVVAVIYVFTRQPIYEVKSTVSIGYIGEKLIDETYIIAEIINIIFGRQIKSDAVGWVSSVTADKKLKNFIEVKTQGVTNEDALQKNKEVLEYIQALNQPEIDEYVVTTKNKIENIKRTIINIDTFEIKNLQEQIRLLKTQKIVEMDEQIKFLKEMRLKAIQSKIDFYTSKLKQYIEGIDGLLNRKNVSSDAEFIGSMKMLNYQNLILTSQNKVEDLKLEKEIILKQTIPALEREKKNITSETIRKLQHQINVDLVNKKIQLAEQIEKLKYNMSEQNVQNSKVVGDYVVKDYPVEPKKKLIVVVAFITGLVLSVFLAFFLEFIQAGRKEEIEEA